MVVEALGYISKGYSISMDILGITALELYKNQSCWEQLRYSAMSYTCKVKASSLPLATCCNPPTMNMWGRRTACAKAI